MSLNDPFRPSDAEERERLRALLREDTGSEAEADALLDTVLKLKRWNAPAADPTRMAALLDALAAEMPRQTRQVRFWTQAVLPALLLLRAQLRVVQGAIWWASGLMMLLGTLVTISTYDAASSTTLPLAIIAPLVAAAGVALLYDTDTEHMLELENATPTSPRLLLLARLALVFGFNLALALAGSLLLTLAHAEISLWPLVMSWLAPMAFLSALAFFVSVTSVEPMVSAGFCLLLWVLHIAMRTNTDGSALSWLLSLPGLEAPGYRPALLAVSVLLLCAALWLAGREDYRTHGLAQ